MTPGPTDEESTTAAGGPGGMPLALRLSEGLGHMGAAWRLIAAWERQAKLRLEAADAQSCETDRKAIGHTAIVLLNCANELKAALAEPDMGIKGRYLVATEKIDKAKRRPVPSVMCSHCPFCGEKLAGD